VHGCRDRGLQCCVASEDFNVDQSAAREVEQPLDIGEREIPADIVGSAQVRAAFALYHHIALPGYLQGDSGLVCMDEDDVGFHVVLRFELLGWWDDVAHPAGFIVNRLRCCDG